MTPTQKLAYKEVSRAKRLGLLKQQPCQRCGFNLCGHVHAHHEDYSKPLDVIWLCNVCHRRRHIEIDPNYQSRPHNIKRLAKLGIVA